MKGKNGEKTVRTDGPDIMQKLSYMRFTRGISIRSVAMDIGVNEITLSSYERGIRPAPFWVIEAYCDVIGWKLAINNEKGKVVYESFGPR